MSYTARQSSGKLLVIVWEWENTHGRWRPYSPEVTQQLERAFMKNLRSVFLGDADPYLQNFCVVLATWEQHCSKTNAVNKVRRNLYPQDSPAGQGAVWQWSGDNDGDWHTYDMCVQCVLEESWTSGAQTVDLSSVFPLCPYFINFCQLTQKNKHTNYCRTIRRKTQASYPIGRPATPRQQPNYQPLNIAPMPSISGVASSQSHQDHDKYRHKEDPDSRMKPDSTKAKGLFNKVLNLTGSSSFSNYKNGMNPPVNNSSTRLEQTTAACAAHPKKGPMPLPRNSTPIAPTPKPRTMFPLQDGHFNPYPQLPLAPHAGSSHQDIRTGSSERLFGSNQTLDSDCYSAGGNFPGVRRPSIETISTYLSLESIGEDAHLTGSLNHASGTRMDNLIHLNDSSDDDVFSEDPEVKSYFMNGNAAAAAGASGGTLQDDSFDQMDCKDNPVSSNSHFVPISDHSADGGAKRKKTDHNKRTSAGILTRIMASQLDSKNSSKKRFNLPHEDQNSNYFETNQKSKDMSMFKIRKPKSKKDKLIVNYSNAIPNPPDEICSICMCDLNDDSGFEENATEYVVCPVISLKICGHVLHEDCLQQLLIASPTATIGGFLQCPMCKTLHGEKIGNQPVGGKMNLSIQKASLPGYSGCGTIKITYIIKPGIQGPEHPNPGAPYTPLGFPRIAYLPDNEKGQRVLRLLQEAFRRRLIFTVGTSVTTNLKNAVTWNEIHHKTEINNVNGHGYPDPLYLDNVIEELRSHGVA